MGQIAVGELVAVRAAAAMLLGIVVEEGSKSICSEGEPSGRQLLIFAFGSLGGVACMAITEKRTTKVVQQDPN